MAPFLPGRALVQPWRGTAGDLVDDAAGQPALWWLRGSRMRTRPGLMDEWAAAAQFPPHFGGTWDALRDALADFPEGATFLILDADQLLQDAPPEDLETLASVLQAVREDLEPRAFRLILQAEEARYETMRDGLKAVGLLA